MRSPRRTAQTASALMVGLALVSAIAVFGASLSKLRHEQRRQRHQRRPHRLDHEQERAGSLQQHGAARWPPPSRASPPPTPSTATSSRSAVDRGPVGPSGPRTCPRRSSLNMTAGSARALSAGDLLIDTTTANADHLVGRRHGAVKFRAHGAHHHAHRRDLPAQRAGREATSSATPFFLRPLPRPAPRRRPVEDRRQPGGAAGGRQGAERLPERAGAVAGPVRGVAGGPGQPAARAGLRACWPWP